MRWMWLPVFVTAGLAGAQPFGVCAHLGSGDEYAAQDKEMALMAAAGIQGARADFSWSYFEAERGQWKFDNYDTIVDNAARHGVQLLPILCYNVNWAFPAHEHLDDWCNYVKTVVTRYSDRLPAWEVWNEPNISFWKPKPDAGQYTALLKATYATIKAINPDLQVVFGGTAGVPLDYLRECFELGATEAFDVLAVHPYQYPTSPEASRLVTQLRDVQALLSQYGSYAPVWITEYGWPTHLDKSVIDLSLVGDLIDRAARLRFPDRAAFAAAVLDEKGLPGITTLGPEVARMLATRQGWTSRLIGLDQITGLDPATTPVLVMPTGEHYPGEAFDQLLGFVREGGLLVHLGGVPFYYRSVLEDGVWQSPGASGAAREALHVGWKAWWTEKGLPEKVKEARPTAASKGLAIRAETESTRWLTDTLLQGNDRFVPLVEAFDNGASVGYPVALYLYDSDLKGGFLGTTLNFRRYGVTGEVQGLYLPRALLLSLAEGVQNIYWYEFREGGSDPYYNEHHFGIINYRDLSPKPAYTAYQALTAALGAARFEAALPAPAGCHALRFDAGGSRTVAVWCNTDDDAVPLTLRVTGDKIRIIDHLGQPVDIQPLGGVLTLKAQPGVQYVTGLQTAES